MQNAAQLHKHNLIPRSCAVCSLLRNAVAGPLSAAVTPRGRCSSRPSSLSGLPQIQQQHQQQQQQQQPSVPAPSGQAVVPVKASGPGAAQQQAAPVAASGLGVFDMVKSWGDGVKVSAADTLMVSLHQCRLCIDGVNVHASRWSY